jgi:hypothetical protein
MSNSALSVRYDCQPWPDDQTYAWIILEIDYTIHRRGRGLVDRKSVTDTPCQLMEAFAMPNASSKARDAAEATRPKHAEGKAALSAGLIRREYAGKYVAWAPHGLGIVAVANNFDSAETWRTEYVDRLHGLDLAPRIDTCILYAYSSLAARIERPYSTLDHNNINN